MKADEFEELYARNSGMTVAELRASGREVLACECGESTCQGWQSIWRCEECGELHDGSRPCEYYRANTSTDPTPEVEPKP